MRYNHIVYIARNGEGCNILRVDRLYEDGRRVFMSEFEITQSSEMRDETMLWDEFEKLGSIVGKSICIDNPELRKILGID